MELPAWNRRDSSRRDLRTANVPMTKWGASLDRVPPEADYLAHVRAYLAELRENLIKGRGLLLWGPYRSGKSSLAACVVREVAAHRCRPYWLEAFELADGWEEQDHRYDFMRSAHLVVVDDLGTEGAHEYRRELVARALRYRLERAGATVVTTNMGPKELEKHYGKKTMALLRDHLLPVKVEGAEWGRDAERGGEE